MVSAEIQPWTNEDEAQFQIDKKRRAKAGFDDSETSLQRVSSNHPEIKIETKKQAIFRARDLTASIHRLEQRKANGGGIDQGKLERELDELAEIKAKWEITDEDIYVSQAEK